MTIAINQKQRFDLCGDEKSERSADFEADFTVLYEETDAVISVGDVVALCHPATGQEEAGLPMGVVVDPALGFPGRSFRAQLRYLPLRANACRLRIIDPITRAAVEVHAKIL